MSHVSRPTEGVGFGPRVAHEQAQLARLPNSQGPSERARVGRVVRSRGPHVAHVSHSTSKTRAKSHVELAGDVSMLASDTSRAHVSAVSIDTCLSWLTCDF